MPRPARRAADAGARHPAMSEFETTFGVRRPAVPAPARHALIRFGLYLIVPFVLCAVGLTALTVGKAAPKVVDDRPKTVEDRASLRLNSEHLARLPVRSQLLAGSRFGRVEMHEYGSIYNRDVNFSLVMGILPDGAVITSGSMPHFSDVHLMRRARILTS